MKEQSLTIKWKVMAADELSADDLKLVNAAVGPPIPGSV